MALMKSSRALVALAALAGLFSMGQVTPGVGTGNGLLPAAYQNRKAELDSFLNAKPQPPQQLFQKLPVPGLPNPTLLAAHTVGCALPGKLPWTYPSTSPLTGEDLMLPPLTAQPPWQPVSMYWPGQAPVGTPANVARREDIHTCLVTRLNHFGVPVRIWLTGEHVTPVDPNYGPFRYPEAVWLASYDKGNDVPPILHVWPLAEVENECHTAEAIVQLISLRVCDQAPTSSKPNPCGIEVHSPKELHDPSVCTDYKSSIWRCRPTSTSPKKPTISTRLGPCAWRKMYAERPTGSLKSIASQCTIPPDILNATCENGEL
jgi:hypothetical protein